MRPIIIIFILISISPSIYGQKEQKIVTGKDSVYQQLLRAKRPANYLNPPGLSYSTKQYYTEKSKLLLLELLKDNWITKAQKLSLAEGEVWKKINNEIATSEAIITDTVKFSRISESRRSHFRAHTDSLKALKAMDVDTVDIFQELLQKQVQEINDRRIPNLYIYTAGMMDDDRYIPILKEMLEDTVKYDPHAVKITLARYQIEPFKSEILDKYKIEIEEAKKIDLSDMILIESNEIFPVVAFISNKEFVREYAKLLELRHFDCIDEGDYQICSVPSSVIIGLYNIILNKDFKSFFKEISPYTITHADIEWAQNWLEQNYGNYELDRNFYPVLR